MISTSTSQVVGLQACVTTSGSWAELEEAGRCEHAFEGYSVSLTPFSHVLSVS